MVPEHAKLYRTKRDRFSATREDMVVAVWPLTGPPPEFWPSQKMECASLAVRFPDTNWARFCGHREHGPITDADQALYDAAPLITPEELDAILGVER